MYLCFLHLRQEHLAPLPRERPGDPVQRKPGKLLEINPRGKKTLASNPGMDIGEVEMIIALPSPRNKLTHLGLVDLAKLRLQQRAHPETSGTFAEYASIRNSCHLVEVIGRNFYCDCKSGIKGKLCPESMALTYDRNPEFPVDPRFSTVIFKRKRPVGRPRNAGLAMSQR